MGGERVATRDFEELATVCEAGTDAHIPQAIPYFDCQDAMQQLLSGRQWRVSVKNSFYHVQMDSARSTNDEIDQSHDGGSSQRSSSVPSRFDHDDVYEDWGRRPEP